MPRKYLSENEVKSLLNEVARDKRSVRNYWMISMAFIHGLRVSELLSLKISDYDPLSHRLQIRRLKGGFSTVHPVLPEERVLLKQWMTERKKLGHHDSEWLFVSRQGRPISRQRFWQILRKYGEDARLSVKVHPHMLRHACGFNLAERGNDTRLIQDYLGHRNIRHTVHYTASNPARFEHIWRNTTFHICSNEQQPPPVTTENNSNQKGYRNYRNADNETRNGVKVDTSLKETLHESSFIIGPENLSISDKINIFAPRTLPTIKSKEHAKISDIRDESDTNHSGSCNRKHRKLLIRIKSVLLRIIQYLE
nr:tyrosine-type DNA invertase [Escherichia albertii]